MATGGEYVRVELPTPVDTTLSGPLREMIRLEACLDDAGRLVTLDVDLRGAGTDGGPGRLELACAYDDALRDPQPEVAVWTLPGGRTVTVRTRFRDEAGRRVPESRRVTFPN